MNNEHDPELCDATDDDSSTADDNIKIYLYKYANNRTTNKRHRAAGME